MKILGFNIAKGRLTYCLIEGPKTAATLLDHGYEKFDPARPIPDMANYFKQTFCELIKRGQPDQISYRMSLEAKKDSISYLLFSYGILNLIAHEQGLHIAQTISQTFSSKALGAKGDKFQICDQLIKAPKSSWDNNYRYAALSALMSFDA